MRPAAFVVGAALLTIASGLLVTVGTHSPSPLRPNAFLPASQPTSWFDNGRVTVSVPTALPSVQLSQDTNGSILSTLVVEGIVELVPIPGSPPGVVAQADMSQATLVSQATSTAAGGWWFNLSMKIPVVSVVGKPPLAPHPGQGSEPGQIGVATLVTGYSLASSSEASGVLLQWTLQSWPYLNTSDLIAVEFGISQNFPGSLSTCAGSGGGPMLGPSPCASGAALSTAPPSWTPGLNGIEGIGPSGPTTLVTWAPTVGVTGGASESVLAGANQGTGGVGNLLLGASTGGASVTRGTVTFAIANPSILPPFVSNLPELVRGSSVPYLGALGLCVLVATGGILAYRKRDQKLRAEL
ncbi:MAG: hypothetical protein L3K09_00140 [Thermoplasmata archaeon]|nr:hypothetical protein [Thermoplasmata archaeon]